VEVKINPPSNSKLPAEKLDELIGGELTRFEKWFLQSQRNKGSTNPQGLISIEKAILTTYILYLATKETSP
jgi:hypothetical protein